MILDEVFQEIIQNIISLVSAVSLACAGVVGAGLTVFGIRWAIFKVMEFFYAISSEHYGEPDDRDDFDDGWDEESLREAGLWDGD